MTQQTGSKLLFDADGVFLDERPYFNAALAAALHMNGLGSLTPRQWDALAEAAFATRTLQGVTKHCGCNSNFDLAVVLAKVLGQTAVHTDVAEALQSQRFDDAAEALLSAAQSLQKAPVGDGITGGGCSDLRDPLQRFGVKRDGTLFTQVVDQYQDVLHARNGLDWPFERAMLKESYEATCAALEQCHALGFELGVCTGRYASEINEPIRTLGLNKYFPADRVTSSDEVDRAKELTGLSSLGKPHWFSPMCAAIGFDAALSRLEGNAAPAVRGDAVYVGDAVADFLAVQACQAQGVSIHYVHVRSPAASDTQIETIAATDWTLGVVDRLGEIPPLVARLVS